MCLELNIYTYIIPAFQNFHLLNAFVASSGLSIHSLHDSLRRVKFPRDSHVACALCPPQTPTIAFLEVNSVEPETKRLSYGTKNFLKRVVENKVEVLT